MIDTRARLCDLGLAVVASPVEAAVARLHAELRAAGITFAPRVYLSDGWGCPDRVPVIGVPFTLASPELTEWLRTEVDDVEDDDFVALAMRHEAAHAFAYAHRLWLDRGYEPLFGSFDAPYPDAYEPTPHHPDFVRHLDGWYAQRHADDDFAETFAVWLRDGDAAIARYAGTRAAEKLRFVVDLVRRFGHATPIVTGGPLDAPLEELTQTLGEWLELRRERFTKRYPPALDDVVAVAFAGTGSESVATALAMQRESIVARVAESTNEAPYFVRRLCRRIERAARTRRLRGDVSRAIDLVTTLIERYAQTRSFV
ncbi:MAG: hypothetical protein HYR85_19170 [Planctomycetes bacterium]|nr:hypothetical protein [Planctomycetota bacterium]MBI3845429.1 hypothetical protein [Planctomycetota bacterium]